ncbi:methyltransferase domain-containing protein [Candidatus Falkowbacteria bacterium]|nr:methyltransferase domain-containing protein [Candidatus Falkowbacteria bacterium]
MNNFLDFIKQVFKNRTIYRILFNRQVRENCKDLRGEILDLAGGGNASYYDYLPAGLKIIKTNYKESGDIDKIIDFNKPLPFADNSINNILFFNALYIVDDRIKLFQEMKRILKPGGKIFISSPFIANEMPEPHDYCRLTAEGLEKEFKEAGFIDFEIRRFGERFTSGAYLLHAFYFFNPIRFFVYGAILLLDKIIPKNIRRNHPAPLGYFCIIKK